MQYLQRKDALGDVVWIEPILRKLGAKGRKIMVVTRYPELFEYYPLPHITFKKRLPFFNRKFVKLLNYLGCNKLSINLNGAYEDSPKEHFLHAYQKKAGLPIVDEYPRLYLSIEEKKLRPIDGKYIVLHISTNNPNNYQQVHGISWDKIIHYIRSLGYHIYLIDNTSSTPLGGVISKKTTIRELMSFIYNADYFLGFDSGPSHIAAAFGVPSILFFGSVLPTTRHFPKLFNGFFLQSYCEFQGCYHVDEKLRKCLLVGELGIPKCSVHKNSDVIVAIDKLLLNYPLATAKKY